MSLIVTKISLLLLLSQIGFAQTVQPPASTDLHMTGRIVSHYLGLTDVELTLTNVSDHDLSLIVGMITNKQLPAEGLKFTMRDYKGEVHSVAYLGGGFIAGRIDPLVVDLRAHQSYVFEVPTESLALPPKYQQIGEMLAQGAWLSVSLDSRNNYDGDPRLSSLPFWKGTVQATVELKIAPDSSQQVGADPKDIRDAVALLERYWIVNDETTVRTPRSRLISWVIQNQPEVCLNNPELLFVNPDDKANYAAVRQLWLKQVETHQHNDCFLENAGVALSLTDRAAAARWLKRSDPRDLGELYANALAGVTGMTPRHGATSFDPKVANSSFPKAAEQEAMSDAELAGQVGRWLHLITNYIRYEKLGDQDFDPLAEKLFLREAELRYPQPTSDSHLRPFYASQQGKPADKQILPKAKIVALSSDELAARRLHTKHTEFEGLDREAKVSVEVVVGVDGHVWKAVAKNAPTEKLGKYAQEELIDAEYSPLRLDGGPVQFSGKTEVTLYPSRPRAAAAHP
jgi:hypothetical protein